MNNKEIKDLLIFNLIGVITFIIISMVVSDSLFEKYKRYQTINGNNIVESYPDLQTEVNNYLTANDDDFKNNIVKHNLTITVASLVSLLIINVLYIRNYINKVNKIDYYVKKVLNDDYSFDIDSVCKGDIGTLKKNVKDLSLKLKSTELMLDKEKHKLEQILDDLYKQMRLTNTNIKVNDKQLILRTTKQVERIELLLSGLIKLAKLDSGTTELNFEKIKLSSLISKSIEPLKEVISSKKIEVKLNIRNTDVYVDIAWMSEALFNILKNACQYTKNEIVIESTTNDNCTEIKISNNGKLISDEDLPHIFEKFNNTGAESLGIGLNLTKEIIERHNATIEVVNQERPTFIIKLFKNN